MYQSMEQDINRKAADLTRAYMQSLPKERARDEATY